MVLSPLGHLQPLGLRSALGHTLQCSLQPPAMLSPVVRSPLFIPTQANQWIAPWSDIEPQWKSQSEMPDIQETNAEDSIYDDSNFIALKSSDESSRSDPLLTQSDWISSETSLSEPIQSYWNETDSSSTTQEPLSDEKLSQETRETPQPQNLLLERSNPESLDIQEIPNVQNKELEASLGIEEFSQVESQTEDDSFQNATQLDRAAIAPQSDEHKTQSPENISQEDTQAKLTSTVQQPELDISSEKTLQPSAEFSPDTIPDPTQRVDDGLQFSDREARTLSSPLDWTKVELVRQDQVSNSQLISKQTDDELISLFSTETEANSENDFDLSSELNLPQGLQANHSNLNSVETKVSPSNPLDDSSSLLDESNAIQTSIVNQTSLPSLLNKSLPENLSTSVDSKPLSIVEAHPQVDPTQTASRSENADSSEYNRSEQVASDVFETSTEESTEVLSQVSERSLNLTNESTKQATESFSLQQTNQTKVIQSKEEAESLFSEVNSENLLQRSPEMIPREPEPSTALASTQRFEPTGQTHTDISPPEVGNESKEIQAESTSPGKQLDIPQTGDLLKTSQLENWSNLEDLLGTVQRERPSPVEQEPWKEQFDFQPQIERLDYSEAASDMLISLWAEPGTNPNPQFGETLISPLVSTVASTNSSATAESGIDDEQFEQLAQIVYRMLRSRYRIDAERYQHINHTHPFWSNMIDSRIFHVTQKNESSHLDVGVSELVGDRHFAALAQTIYRTTQIRLKYEQERNSKSYHWL